MTLTALARLTLVLLVALPAMAGAEDADVPPLPQRNPFRAPAAAKPVLPKDQPTIPWTAAEIDAATAKCKTLLTGNALDYEVLPPIKEGLCGAPAPVLLRAVGHDPKVTIDPPATLTCPMAAALGEWLENTVQPKAQDLFGNKVVKLQNASSYVCRNRYNGTNTLLSEHALANAFDVSQFVLANGTRITVLADWPRVATTTPRPESNVASAAAKGEANKKGGDTVTKARVVTEDNHASAVSASSNPFVTPKAGARGSDMVTPAKAESTTPPSPLPVVTEDDHTGDAVSSNPFVKSKSRGQTGDRGGDRGEGAVTPATVPSTTPAPPPVTTEPAPDAKGQFVTFLFAGACRRFGTVLGPNANEAHKDHFHLDMKSRRKTNFCE
ncbi:MAG TPA: extensin family protein [Methyloceanibacter sp.]|nr:extensin family protein [Methyloceanibacter sp.]